MEIKMRTIFPSICMILLFTFFVFTMFSTVNSATIDAGTAQIKNPVSVTIVKAPSVVVKPAQYASSSQYKTTSIETKKNTIKTSTGNINYTFTTEYFLPAVWKYRASWVNVQSIERVGNYMYVVVSDPSRPNTGFIVRYDMSILNKYKINQAGSTLPALRKIGDYLRDGKQLSSTQLEILKAIKIGPKFNIGHGQSLAYNPKTKTLWMWQDDVTSSNLKLLQISTTTLKPVNLYKFQLEGTGFKISGVHNLAFDKDGYFYIAICQVKSGCQVPVGGVKFYRGKISGTKVVNVSCVKSVISHFPGTIHQSIEINPVTNCLYLISDDVFYMVPISKLLAGTITVKDLKYTKFSTDREFESVTFDPNGKEYLLLLRGPEILKAR